MRSILLTIVTALLFTSCGEFSRALKSTDLDYKVATAEKYFEDGKWDRAIPLLEELIVLTRGSERSERMNYLHAKAHFGMKDYILGAYYLANFTRTFPRSAYAEESAFLSAYCHYMNSPSYELDQSDTRNAIDQMQLFMVRYPNTALRDSCNMLIDRMRGKLERKSYEASKQYYHMRNFQAAGVAMRNFLREWPNSGYREEVMMLMLRADHNLAVNSVERKQKDRVEEAIRTYYTFADAFPKSDRIPEAQRMHKELLLLQGRFENKPAP